jgi:uncharacterized protein (UPF0335 family)
MTTEDRIIAEKDGSFTVNLNGGEATLVNKDLAVLLARVELLEQECKALREQVNGV